MSRSMEQSGWWRERWARMVHSPDDMVRFVDAVGCCTSLPVSGFPDFPNQREAVGKLDPGVPDQWFWKDDLHIEKRIYYTRVFGGQPGFVSFELLPVLIATNGAVIDELRFEGLVSPEVQQVYDAVESLGPVATGKLKRMLTPDARRAASKILIDLDRKFLVTKTGLTGRTRGTYSYIWDLTERWIPDSLAAADGLGRREAEQTLWARLAGFGIGWESRFWGKVLGWE